MLRERFGRPDLWGLPIERRLMLQQDGSLSRRSRAARWLQVASALIYLSTYR